MQPQFVQRPELKVVGLGAKFISGISPDKNNAAVIPPLFDRFINQIDQIKNKTGDGSWGLVEMLPADEKSHRDELFYIAAAEVSDVDSIPPGMISRVIPAGRYAQFTHKGKLTGLEATMKFIYQTWVPQSGQRLRNSPHLERYDRRFDLNSDQSEFDILLPVA